MGFFADRLKGILAAKGITPYRLSQLSGVRQSTLSGILNGKSNPAGKTLQKIAAALDVSMAEFDDRPPGKPNPVQILEMEKFRGKYKGDGKKVKAVSADERTRLDEALEEVKKLSPEAREHLLAFISELKKR